MRDDDIRSFLDNIQNPLDGRSLGESRMVDGLAYRDGIVQIVLNVDPAHGTALESLRQHVEQQLQSLPDIRSATVMLSQHKQPAQPSRKPPPGKISLPNIRAIIAVASGKGGVGKSTISANLAVGLAQKGLKTGLLDADIYGPSVPMMMGITEKPQTNQSGDVLPIMRHGVGCMSIGVMSRPDQALIWRGPMVQGALMQLLRDVAWGNLDVLILDLPPGTGDIQLTMCQQIPLTGAVIVSTPQDIALIDARKAIAMFERVHVPVLGMVENMSMFCCPNCGTKTAIFGQHGAEEQARNLQIPFLGAVPLALDIRTGGDNGIPAILSADRAGASLRTITDGVATILQDLQQRQSRHNHPHDEQPGHNSSPDGRQHLVP